MVKKITWLLVLIVGVIILYFVAWPVPVDPVAWEAPPNPGYTGPFTVNTRLKGVETFVIAGNHGPEDIALDAQGRIYAATHEGYIVRLSPDGGYPINTSVTETNNYLYIGSLATPVLERLKKDKIGL